MRFEEDGFDLEICLSIIPLVRLLLPLLNRLALFVGLAFFMASCATKDTTHTIRVSVKEQKMVVMRRGVPIATYPVSTSKFGLGDRPGSNYTPLGKLEVAKKIGGGQPLGMKFKSRRPTGEIVPVNAPGRDPIVTRILWLRGTEAQNRKTFGRGIYIHGTPEEYRIGQPASYGCVRMRSRDVISLYNTVGEGARVEIQREAFTPTATPVPVVRAESQIAGLPQPPTGTPKPS